MPLRLPDAVPRVSRDPPPLVVKGPTAASRRGGPPSGSPRRRAAAGPGSVSPVAPCPGPSAWAWRVVAPRGGAVAAPRPVTATAPPCSRTATAADYLTVFRKGAVGPRARRVERSFRQGRAPPAPAGVASGGRRDGRWPGCLRLSQAPWRPHVAPRLPHWPTPQAPLPRACRPCVGNAPPTTSALPVLPGRAPALSCRSTCSLVGPGGLEPPTR